MDLQIDCPPSYPNDAKIVFVGEGPGAEEVEARDGFVGAAGRCLQRACSIAGIKWESVGRTNVAKRRPPGNKFREAFYETVEEPIYTKTGKLSKKTKKTTRKTDELLAWEDGLQSELQSARRRGVNLVVAAGAEALEAITGHRGITDYRGSIVESKWDASLKVLAVEHPSYIIRGQMLEFWVLVHDIKKAARQMQFPEIKRETINIVSEPQLEEALAYMDYVRMSGARWTLDFETHKYTGTVKCFAIGFQQHGVWTGVAVGLQDGTRPLLDAAEETEVWGRLGRLAATNPYYVNQNCPFDIFHMLKYRVEPSGVWMDTMLAHSILYPEFPKSLAFQCSLYQDDVVYYKSDDLDMAYNRPMPELKVYACRDAIHTGRNSMVIDKQLQERGLYEFYHGTSRAIP